MTFDQYWMSERTTVSSWGGVMYRISKPAVSADFRTAGDSRASLAAALSFSTAAGGVPLGANSATQASSSKPGNPASAEVGTSGNWAKRFLAATASGRS